MLSTLTSSYLAALDFCLLEFSLMSLSVAGSSYLKKKENVQTVISNLYKLYYTGTLFVPRLDDYYVARNHQYYKS